jgi:hypothetical protein
MAIHLTMHAYLSTQFSRKLRYYDLICCGGVHESESTCGEVGVNQATPSAGSAPVASGRLSSEDGLGVNVARHGRHDHIIIKRTEGNRTCPGKVG